MNEFEKKMNALRLQFKAEQRQITKDANRYIGRLNSAIGSVDSQEARDALRAEKRRVYAAMRSNHDLNRACYLDQLEQLNAQQASHFEANPSTRQLRRLVARIATVADNKELKTLDIAFGNNRHAIMTFSD